MSTQHNAIHDSAVDDAEKLRRPIWAYILLAVSIFAISSGASVLAMMPGECDDVR